MKIIKTFVDAVRVKVWTQKVPMLFIRGQLVLVDKVVLEAHGYIFLFGVATVLGMVTVLRMVIF